LAKLIIKGNNPLKGKIKISGAKNAAVAAIPAALLSEGAVHIENIPLIKDVCNYMKILQSIGADVETSDDGTATICFNKRSPSEPPYDLIKRLRASYYLLGALIGRFKEARIPLPGGCDLGFRPIDQHIKGFKALGCDVNIGHGIVDIKTDKLVGAPIYLDVVSVGATINIMLAACRAEGTTVIENAAKEPHIVDVANLLNSMGGNIKGAGTDVIKIRGVDRLHGCNHYIIPDQIEAGTFMVAAAATKGDVLVDNVITKHLDPITAKLAEAGCVIEQNGDYIRVTSKKRPKKVCIKTLPYPGFPTDLQQPFTAYLSVAEGTSLITETIWENRFKHVDELKRMGANIKVDGRSAVIEGVKVLSGAPVKVSDLRAGAALLIAGLMAEGVTEIDDIYHIDRGYENVEQKFGSLGADIERVDR
jgi:UDP-N-acetylglucosamine 1-carboxyvinyltransferase